MHFFHLHLELFRDNLSAIADEHSETFHQQSGESIVENEPQTCYGLTNFLDCITLFRHNIKNIV